MVVRLVGAGVLVLRRTWEVEARAIAERAVYLEAATTEPVMSF